MMYRYMFGALFVLSINACGDSQDALRLDAASGTQAQAIVGGSPCEEAEFPETGLVAFLDQASCTGTLIAPDTVLTAAHCVLPIVQLSKYVLQPRFLTFTPHDGITRDQPTVAARDYVVDPDYRSAELCTAPRSEEEQRACRRVWTECGLPHEDPLAYRDCVAALPEDLRYEIGAIGPGQIHDVALLFLETSIPSAHVATLLPPHLADRLATQTAVNIVGYGLHTPLPDISDAPTALPVKRWARTAVGDVGSHELLTAAAPSAHACHGDSGGPLWLTLDESGRQVQVGIASRIDNWRPQVGCASGLVYSRVDTHLAWIEQSMRIGCDDGARVSCETVEVAEAAPSAMQNTANAGCTAAPPTLWAALLLLGCAVRTRRARHEALLPNKQKG